MCSSELLIRQRPCFCLSFSLSCSLSPSHPVVLCRFISLSHTHTHTNSHTRTHAHPNPSPQDKSYFARTQNQALEQHFRGLDPPSVRGYAAAPDHPGLPEALGRLRVLRERLLRLREVREPAVGGVLEWLWLNGSLCMCVCVCVAVRIGEILGFERGLAKTKARPLGAVRMELGRFCFKNLFGCVFVCLPSPWCFVCVSCGSYLLRQRLATDICSFFCCLFGKIVDSPCL